MEERCQSMESIIEQLPGYCGLREQDYSKNRPNFLQFICCPYAGLSKVDL